MGGITTSDKKEGMKGLGIYVGCLAMGVATLKFGSSNVTWLGYGLTALGGTTTVLDVVRNTNPYKRLFENLKLGIGGQVPRFLGKRKTDYGYCLSFRLLPGMSTDDFEKKQLAIEQHLNKKIEIAYDNWRIFIKVYEKEIESSQPFKLIETKGKCEFPIGIKLNGEAITIDLAEEPHLLIGGQTGGGKSTLLRGMITSLILTKPNIHLYLIDLKGGVEFNVFKKSKNVKAYCKNKEEAEKTLNTMINEVHRRLDLFNENDVVDIGEYNKLKGKLKLNYLFIIIDEFAELQNEKGSISSVETLGAMARACGIHLIISTQRPDMKVVNGRIKNNFPYVIGLKTLNKINSGIIIDQEGLEKLRGKGHGYLKYSDLTEFQSMYLTNQQARDLIKHTYIEKSVKLKVVEKIEKIEDFNFLKKLEG